MTVINSYPQIKKKHTTSRVFFRIPREPLLIVVNYSFLPLDIVFVNYLYIYYYCINEKAEYNANPSVIKTGFDHTNPAKNIKWGQLQPPMTPDLILKPESEQNL